MAKQLATLIAVLLVLTSCGQPFTGGKLKKAGLLVPDTISDQVWGTKGYKGLLSIQSEYNVDVFYKEGMKSEGDIERAVEDFVKKGTNLIFGHGDIYEPIFNKLSERYPDVQFVFFNGDSDKKNVTSIKFKAEAMGFFGGMIASRMSKTNEIGILASYEWQPEVAGFIEGSRYQDKEVKVDVEYVGSWDDKAKALELNKKLISRGVDVVYPAGDGYNIPVIQQLKANGLYAIGYINDQIDLGDNVVLTSTVQNVDHLYETVARKFNDGTLESGTCYVDFQEDIITLGDFSPLIPYDYQNKINQLVKDYKQTGKLPNEGT
ncbi:MULTISPECIES: BMP family ABC transporter substrate-binding protein [Bacillus]|uniref:BMP family ABC transporter substrate-binding protein n=1 Tax=Bacillus TaxID=1386 RepID=UPI000B02407D